MDRIIQKKKWTVKKISWIIGISAFSIFFIYNIFFSKHLSKLNIEKNKLTISTVQFGTFQEYISVLGNIIPGTTRYLDSKQPGIIEKIYKESGEMVKKGEAILELSNSTLELNVMTQESALYERLSIINNSRLQLDQNNLNQLAQLANINYQINILEPQYIRAKKLIEKKLISQQDYEQIKEQYLYNVKSKKLFLESYKNDSIARSTQLVQLIDSEKRMRESLKGVREMMAGLIIKAPIDGQLSAPDLEIGQSISTGERLGQIDVIGDYKVRVSIDEHYLSRINEGQLGTFDFNNKKYTLKIFKIYPTVANGVFNTDMLFTDEIFDEIKSGQNLQIRLELGNSIETLLLPVGSFYNTTGGNWIFIISNDQKSAKKIDIKLGRKNPKFFEVNDGLNEGDKVIISSYELFENTDMLILK